MNNIKKRIIVNVVTFCAVLCICLFAMNMPSYSETIESNPLIDIYKKFDASHIDIIKNVIIKDNEIEWDKKISDTISHVIPRYKYKMSYFDDNDKYIEYKGKYGENIKKIRKIDRNCLVLELLINFFDNNYTNKRVESEKDYEETYLYEKMLLSDFINSVDKNVLTEYLNPTKKIYDRSFYDSYFDSYFNQLDFNVYENYGLINPAFYIATEYRGIFPTDAEIEKKYKKEARTIKKLFEPLNFETYKRIEPLFHRVDWLFKYDYNKNASESEALGYLIEAYNYIKEDNKFYDVKLDY